MNRINPVFKSLKTPSQSLLFNTCRPTMGITHISQGCRSINQSATLIESGPSYWTVNGQICPYGEASFVHDPTGQLYSSIRFDKKGPQPKICMVYDKKELNVMPGSISFYALDTSEAPGPYQTSGEADFV